MSNINFNVDAFAGLTTLFEYGGLIKSMDAKYVNGELNYYIGLKTKEDIKKFLAMVPDWQVDCFSCIQSISKALFYCETKELSQSDISVIMGLLIALGEIGSNLTEECRDMTEDNTFPLGA